MKKIIAIIGLYLFGFLQACICPMNSSKTNVYKTIETVRGIFYSFDQNGIFPYLDAFNRRQLGLSVFPDSVSERIEISQSISPISSAYACEDPTDVYYVNSIDSVIVFTVFDYDNQHLAGTSVNDILKPMDIHGKTTNNVEISELFFVNQYFKFSSAPTFDSMQFIITGNISGKQKFQVQTDLIVLTK